MIGTRFPSLPFPFWFKYFAAEICMSGSLYAISISVKTWLCILEYYSRTRSVDRHPGACTLFQWGGRSSREQCYLGITSFEWKHMEDLWCFYNNLLYLLIGNKWNKKQASPEDTFTTLQRMAYTHGASPSANLQLSLSLCLPLKLPIVVSVHRNILFPSATESSFSLMAQQYHPHILEILLIWQKTISERETIS